MELRGVRQRGWSCENQRGTRLSQPAVMGRRVRPVKMRLELAMARAISRKMANGAANPARPVVPMAARMVCGMGPMTLMGCPPMKARTTLVPRMNISEMMGAEIMTDCPTVRAALRHSPAMMATYSKPLKRADRHLAEDGEAEEVRAWATPRGWLRNDAGNRAREPRRAAPAERRRPAGS